MSLILTGLALAGGVILGRLLGTSVIGGKKDRKGEASEKTEAKEKPKVEPKTPELVLEGFPCRLGDVVLRSTGDEAWLAGAIVLSEADSLDLLLRVVADGGNLLLMVSPDGGGRVPPNQERRLRFLGAWLERYGEAVYATRPVGLSEQPSWGYLTKSKTGDRLYCIVRRWPSDGALRVPVAMTATEARVIGGAAQPRVKSDANGIDVDLGVMRPPDEHASVIVLTVK